ncbi:malate synthase [Streptomyces noursei]|uniref:Malate synthase n=1 Tax=Streptomyces noursei TaxID=1971 RepID=A0A401QRQ8_STRNR|nr:malate synthase [Streptomyces noursei]
MEDAATAEIARVQIWQWLRHRVIDRRTVERVLDEEAAALGPSTRGRPSTTFARSSSGTR